MPLELETLRSQGTRRRKHQRENQRASPQNLSTMERKDWKCCRLGSPRREERRGTKSPGHHAVCEEAVWKATKNSPVCKKQGLHFTQDFTKEDRQAREQLWPKIKQARSLGKVAFYKGHITIIDGRIVTA